MPDFYDYGGRLQRKLEQIKIADGINDNNKRKIIEFQRSCLAHGLSSARMLRYLNDLPTIAKKLRKDFKKAQRSDIEKIVAEIEAGSLAPATKQSYIVTIKKFYKWLNGGEEYPGCVKWLKTTGKKNNERLPEDLLTEEEIKRMIEVASNPRDRALIAVLWESGSRVGELLSMQMKHISFEQELTRITINGKTGPRRIPLLDSTPYLAEWMENHPLKSDPSAPLWISLGTTSHHQPLQYGACRKMLQEIAKRALIKKSVNPHSYRHARATFLAKHLKEAQLNKYFGWTQGSDIPQVYVHLSGRDIDDAILEMRGLKTVEKKIEDTLASKKCARCGTINKSTGNFCIRCGLALDLRVALALKETSDGIDKYLTKILEDKDIQGLIRSKLKDMTNNI